MKKLYAFIIGICLTVSVHGQLVYKDVAGIFYNRCTSCHHQNQHAQSMMNYSETYPWSSSIEKNLQSGKMPPWMPDTTYSRFLHERIITPSEKNAILSWISTGSLQGDTTLAPAAPVYPQYELYGIPTMTLQIPVFTSNANTDDAYNCFALPTGLTEDRYLRAYEVVPGNISIVHHVVMSVDTTGTVTNDLSGACFQQPGDFEIGGYAPGAPPTIFPGQAPLKAGIRIKAGSKIVLQIHYPAGTSGQKDSTKIRLYFYPANETGIRPVYSTTPLQNWSLIIPANTVKTFSASYSVPTAISLFATFPHSHKVCTSIVNYAYKATDTIPIIRINKWDFNWQGYYTYPNLIQIPAGYTLRSSHVYDNTTNNPDNPFSPPQLIVAGTSTTDEMLFDAIQWFYYQAGDESIDINSLLANDTLLNPSTSINNNSPSGVSVVIYPNPFSHSAWLRITNWNEFANEKLEFRMFDVLGREVRKLRITDSKLQIKRENLPGGIYFYKVSNEKKEIIGSGKVVIE